MRFWIALAALTLAAATQAEQVDWSADWNKQEYVRNMMEFAKDNPKWNPTREKLEARFDRLDTNGDGKLSKKERNAGKNR